MRKFAICVILMTHFLSNSANAERPLNFNFAESDNLSSFQIINSKLREDRFQNDSQTTAVKEAKAVIEEVINASFPELKNVPIKIKTFRSKSDYFRSIFSAVQFLTGQKMRFVMLVNPEVFSKNAPAQGIRAITAHELAHILYYLKHSRAELFGFVFALTSKSFTARFERRADLEALRRGYGAGLKIYRQWLYQNIPAKRISEKQRNYFSPAEIDLILETIKQQPDFINRLFKRVPRSFNEIRILTSVR